MDIEYFQGWKIEKKSIGIGAYGEVYKITRDVFGHTEEAALKVIDIPKSQEEVESFKNEGMTDENVTTYFQGMVEKIVEEFVLMSRLKGNSNIVSYEDHVVEEKKNEFGWRIYIRMELLTPLFTYVKEHGMSEQDIIKLGIDICKGLELCKKYNIIHRDIKPENILISPAGDFKLGDFGIARELEKTAAGLSKVGTLNYMAPEVNKGFEYNSTVDIYSLGIVLYRLLNENRLPFMPPVPLPIKFSDQDLANTMRLSGQQIPKPSKASEELASIVLKACAYLPKDRYELAKDMRKALEKLRKEETDNNIILEIKQSVSVENDYKEEKDIDAGQLSEDSEKTDMSSRTILLFNPKTSMSDRSSDSNVSNQSAVNEKKEIESEKHIDNIENSDVKPHIDRENLSTKVSGVTNNLEQKNKFSKKIAIIPGIVLLIVVFCVMIILKNNNGNGQKRIESVSATDPTEIPIEKSTQEPTEAPVEKSIEEPTEIPAEINTEEPTGVPVEKVMVPDLSNMTQGELESKLVEYKLVFDYADKEYSEIIEKGRVISQSPAFNTEVEAGSIITIVLSKGMEKVSVPSVKGLSQKEAKEKLKEKGLNCVVEKKYNSLTKGYVYDQSVKAKSKVEKGKTVTIYVSKGAKPVQATKAPSYSNNKSNTTTQRPSTTKKPSNEKIDGTFQ